MAGEGSFTPGSECSDAVNQRSLNFFEDNKKDNRKNGDKGEKDHRCCSDIGRLIHEGLLAIPVKGRNDRLK